MAYSIDLRKRVVDAVKVDKMTQEKAASCFSVSLGSVKRWLNRPCLKAKKTGPQKPFTLSHEALLAVVNATSDCYLDEYARQLQTSRSTVCYHLKKLAWTRKKNGALPRKK